LGSRPVLDGVNKNHDSLVIRPVALSCSHCKQNRQCVYNVTLWCIHVTIVVEMEQCILFFFDIMS